MSVTSSHTSGEALIHRAIREVAAAGIDASGVLVLVAVQRLGTTDLRNLSVVTGLCEPRVRSLLADLRAAELLASKGGGA